LVEYKNNKHCQRITDRKLLTLNITFYSNILESILVANNYQKETA